MSVDARNNKPPISSQYIASKSWRSPRETTPWQKASPAANSNITHKRSIIFENISFNGGGVRVGESLDQLKNHTHHSKQDKHGYGSGGSDEARAGGTRALSTSMPKS